MSRLPPVSEDAGEAALHIAGKPVRLELSRAARQALAERSTPLCVEMELYFSCLIRLRVRFPEQIEAGDGVGITDKLIVRFRPVMTRSCGRDYEGEEPPLTDFPIARPEAFMPKWLRLDYRHGEWQGEFGMASS